MEPDFLQQNWYWVLLATASGTFVIVDTIRTAMDRSALAPMDATNKINREDATVIDVREKLEYTQGHIPNARHIPLAELDRRLPELSKLKNSPLIVCCASGSRSRTALAKLKNEGFEQVFNLRGGINEWEKAGQPLATGRKAKGKK
ncbi:MAG TPA: rhodanese-like domain-containing protein [Azoarcus sp.]|nr:rhodanese-like domain-containing protein [Azoarcus sp.]